MHVIRLLVAATAVALVATGCTGSPSAPRAAEARTAACPDDVEVSVLADHSCGEVVRADGSRIFFLRVEPPGPPVGNPVVETGNDLGTMPGYVGLAPIAQRTGRELVVVDLPGVGHSVPSLACPTVDRLSTAMADDPVATMPLVVDAIALCREAVHDQVAVRSSAAALHDVVTALGLEQVVAMSHGTTGQVSLAWAAAHPGDLEALVLDTPLVTDADPIDRLDGLVADVAAACADQPACHSAHADLEAQWVRVQATLRSRPLEIDVDGATVPVDEQQLRRAVLWAAGGLFRSQALPELLDAADRRDTGDDLLQRFGRALLNGPPLCVGYLPSCAGVPRVAVGAMLSLNCATLLEDDAWRDACTAWGAEPEALPDHVSTPTLVLTGRYDPFARTADVRAVLEPVLDHAFFVEDPAGGHNVLGGDCIRELRTGWLAGDVNDAPQEPDCLAERVIPFPEGSSS
jgi:pimeloyl-ACP methyl ester carboxylesterase